MSLAELVEEMLNRMVDGLPAGAATLEKIPPRDGSIGWTFTVTPARPVAARIHVAVDEPFLYLSLGRGAVYELGPKGRHYSDLTQLDELRALCLAAVNGRFRETVRFKGEVVVGARGWAMVGSEEVGDLWGQVFTNPFRRTRKRSYVYEPYVPA